MKSKNLIDHPPVAQDSCLATCEHRQPDQPTLLTLKQLCAVETGFKEGGIRHLIFTKGHDLPGVYRLGSRILFDRFEFIGGIKAGATAHIAGMKK